MKTTVFILTVAAYYILTNTSLGACQCQHIKIYRTLFKIHDSYDFSAWKNSTDHDKNSSKGISVRFVGGKRYLLSNYFSA